MLKVNQLFFSYKNRRVLNNISFKAKQGENIAIIGESGSGKSTLLKLIYGEHDLDKGEIFWKNTKILGPKFNLVVGYNFMKRVTQEFNIMPFITVAENIGKHLSRFYPEERQKRIAELLKVVELEAFANSKVKNLSGGQKQRVALARALAKQPQILLLDEPFSHIDNFKKQVLRRNLFRYLKEKQITCIVATHNKNDVLGFADTILVLNNTKIIEKGSPQALYNNPKTQLVASFFGDFSIIDNTIYYAHQLKIVKKSNRSATVKHSYFNGKDWLIEAIYNGNNIFISHHKNLKPNERIFFK